MTERILVVHVAAIGDTAVASTLLERLRAEHAGAEITWVCGSEAAPVVALYDGIARIVPVDRARLFRGGAARRGRVIVELWSRLAGRRYDLILIVHPDRRYRVLVWPLRGRKLQLSRAEHGRMIPVPARFLGDEYARLAGGTRHEGPIERRYAMSDLRSRFPISAARAGARVLLVPGGAKNVLRDDALRRWPLAHYAEVASALIDEGCEVVLIGGATDAWVRPAFEGLRVRDEIGALSLPETLALMAASDVVVSHDTGPMHLARLVRTPVIAIFGPTIPAQVLSIDETVTVLWGGEQLACRPCFDGREFARCAENLCMKTVMPVEVVAAARRVLHGRAATPASSSPPRRNSYRPSARSS